MAEYDARRSEEAFAALVRQHINLVFATALRQVGDRGAAEEITQNVFVALAQSSDKLKSHPTIAGWLYRTTLNKSRERLRSDLRRRHREEIAVSRELAHLEGDSVWSPLVPLLDEALLKLREPDRLAVIMHFMEGQTFHEVGSALGVDEDTARKRVHRCLGQLTQFFRRHGFAVPGLTPDAPLFALSLHSAPAGLAKTISVVAVAKAAATSASTVTLLKGALKFMAWTNTKTAIAIGIGLLIAAGTAAITVKGIEAFQTPAWQKYYDLSFVDKLPPQVKILPSLSSTLQSGLDSCGTRDGKVLGLGQSVPDILMMAYAVRPAQLIWNAPVLGTRFNTLARYDYLSNFPQDNDQIFQQAVLKKFGLVIRHETFETNALVLAVKFSNAPGLRPSSGESSDNREMNSYSLHDDGIGPLMDYLESCLGTVIVDQTQLPGNYDIDFKWDGKSRDGLQRALLDQTGLELVPTNLTVQMLEVEQAK